MAWLLRLTYRPGGSGAPDPDVVASLLWDRGTTGIAELDPEPGGTTATLVAGFDDRDRADEAAALVRDRFGDTIGIAGIEPYRWAGTGDTAEVPIPDREDLPPLRITAGPTFGHGGHPTTALALGFLADVAEPGRSVLDIGTGSGVLAVAAAALGAGPVVGLDIDEAAVGVVAANAEANGVPAAEVLVGAAADAATRLGGRRFDVVVANVLRPIQADVATVVAALVAEGGELVTSGYLAGDAGAVEDLHRGAGLDVVERRDDGDWVGHRFRAAGSR